jgi:hypothetical protein
VDAVTFDVPRFRLALCCGAEVLVYQQQVCTALLCVLARSNKVFSCMCVHGARDCDRGQCSGRDVACRNRP